MAIPREIFEEQAATSLRLTNKIFLIDETKNKNVILSPLSIHIALSMVAAGAVGLAKDQIISFLGAESEEQLHNFAFHATDVIFSDSSASGGPKLSAANAVWLRDSLTFKSSFKQILDTHYKAATKHLDFTKVNEAVREVNAWAEEMTNGCIKDIVDNFSIDTVMVLANALYFKATWYHTFEPEYTYDDTFHIMDGTSFVKAPFMRCGGRRAIATYDTFKVLKLPYYRGYGNDRSFSMSIFLPNEIDGLPSLVHRICTEGNNFLENHIPKKNVDVGTLRIPKFKIELKFSVMDALEELGLKNLGRLREVVVEEHERVVVSNIVHKAFVEVTEAGTEAAAVTEDDDMGYGLCDSPPVVEYVDFIADHPFMFVIREDSTGLVLFAGRVLNPLLVE